MPKFEFEQRIQQLEKRKGDYYYFKLPAATVNQFEKKRATRLRCLVDNKVSYSCGLNHFGDGDYFIILSTQNLRALDKNLGESVKFEIAEDPNPLGVEIPELLQVFLEEDQDAARIFDAMTDGKKRSLIHSIGKVKDLDKQINKIATFLAEQAAKRVKRTR